MKHTFLTFVLIWMVTSINAQDNKLLFGISSSLDYNSYLFVKDDGPQSYHGRINYSGGLVLKYSINSRWTVITKVLYSTKNYQEKIDFDKYRPINPNDPLLLAGELIITNKNKYLDIPFELNYKLNQIGNTGMLLCFGIVNSFQLDYSNKTNFNSSIPDWKRYNDYLLGIKIGFGLLFEIGEFGLHVEPQTKIYLTEVHDEYPNENPIHFGIEIQVIK